jgi:hypothetical protein
MLHEWDVDAPPFPLPFVTLTSRQATKIVEFVGQQHPHVNQLIVQSEFASSQLTAIAETIGDWTSAFLERGDVWPAEHKPTNALLEMAFDAFELSGQARPRFSVVRSSEDNHVLKLIEFVCSLANVVLIASSRIQECYTATPDRRGDIDASLGVCLEQEQLRYRRRDNTSENGGKTIHLDLESVLASRERRVCCQGGCPSCLEAIEYCNMPVCLAVVMHQSHLPPTFEHVLEAGGNWAIVTRRQMMGRIKRTVGGHREVQITRRRESDFGLITIGDASICDVLHEVYRM